MADIIIRQVTRNIQVYQVGRRGPQGEAGEGVPIGGTTGQILRKVSGDNYDTEWSTASGTGDMLASVYDPQNILDDAFDRPNHTGTQTASTISDFDTEVSNNTDVAANTAARHVAVTVSDTAELDFTLTGQQISASLKNNSIDESKLDVSTNTSLDLADSSLQPGDNVSELTNDAGYSTTTGTVDTTNSPNANEFARFTDSNTVEGRTVAETKSDLSLGNVDNTSDVNKPISTATQAALDAIESGDVDSVNGSTGVVVLDQDDIGDGTIYKQYSQTEKTKLAGIATGATANDTDANLKARANHTGTQAASTISDFSAAADARISNAAGVSIATLSGGKVPTSQIPAVALVEVYTVGSQVAQLALTADEGDVAIRTDLNKSYVHNGGTAGTMADWSELLTPTDAVLSVNGNTGAVTIDKASVGLSNVDNTADTAKPVSTAQQTALDLKANIASPTLTGTPAAPTAAAATNTTQIATTAHVFAERTNSSTLTNKTLTSPVINTPTGIVKGDVGLGNVDNTSDANKPVSTATQTALDAKQPLDSDLTTIAGLTATTDNFMVATASAWASRTPSQARSQLGLGALATLATVGTSQIDDAAITLAKMANLAQDQFIGRTTASTGVPQTATITSAARTVLDDTTVSAMIDTLGGASATGSGGLVRATSPTLVTPALGTPSSGTLTNATGLPVSGITASTSTAIGVGSVELGHATDTTISRVSAGKIAVEGIEVSTATSTLTLTNKRITPRIGTTASSATPTPNADTDDQYTVTALAAGATFGAPTGTPTDGQNLIIRIKDNGTARTLAWNAIYRPITITMPTTTVISKTMYLGMKYNSADTKWDVVAYALET